MVNSHFRWPKRAENLWKWHTWGWWATGSCKTNKQTKKMALALPFKSRQHTESRRSLSLTFVNIFSGNCSNKSAKSWLWHMLPEERGLLLKHVLKVKNISLQPHTYFWFYFGILRPLALKTLRLNYVVNTWRVQSQNRSPSSLTATTTMFSNPTQSCTDVSNWLWGADCNCSSESSNANVTCRAVKDALWPDSLCPQKLTLCDWQWTGRSPGTNFSIFR